MGVVRIAVVAFFLMFYIFGALLLFPLYLVTRKRIGGFMFRKWAKILLEICGVDCETEGLENIDPNETYFVVANHRSISDIPIIAAVLPLNLRIMAKKELFKIPFLGQTMLLYDFVPIDRRNRRTAVKSLENARKKMKTLSFLVFPEGTRSRTEQVEKFKSGALWLTENGCQILPVALTGAEKIMEIGRFAINSGKVRMKILPPVRIRENESRQELAERLQKIVSDGVKSIGN